MAAITVTKITKAGVAEPAGTACTGGGDTVKLEPGYITWVELTNGHSSAQTATGAAKRTCSQGSSHDVGPVSVPGSGGVRRIGPFEGYIYNNANGNLELTYSGVTAMTIRAWAAPIS